MERSGHQLPAVGHDQELSDLLRGDGPFLTIWASRPSTVQPSTRSHRAALRDAAGHLISADVVEDLADAVGRSFPAEAGVVGIADSTGVRVIEPLPEPPRADLVRLQSLPSLSPIIEHRQGMVPFVLVVADRHGADLVWSDGTTAGSDTVQGQDGPITKVPGGGWAQRRFQQRVQDTWEHTASEIAVALEERVARISPRVVTVGGDTRILQLLRERVSAHTAALLRDVPGGRSHDGAEVAREHAVRKWVRTAVAEDTVAVLRAFEQERGRNDRAADGASATFTALREGRVDVLLVHDDPSDVRPAWFVPGNPLLVSNDYHVLAQLGHRSPRDGRLIDVAIMAALCSSASVRIVPGAGPVNDGLGAILRW